MRKSKYTDKFKIGDRYKKWTIVDNKIIPNERKEAQILAKCDCGEVKLTPCYYLLKQNSTGCSNCGHGNKGELNPQWKGYKEVQGTFLARIKSRARKMDVAFKITSKDIYNLWIEQNKKCSLSGVDISFTNTNTSTKKKHSKYDLICTASVDRIDSSKGYTLDNIQLLHKDINMIKKDYSQDYFIEMCRLISKNLKL